MKHHYLKWCGVRLGQCRYQLTLLTGLLTTFMCFVTPVYGESEHDSPSLPSLASQGLALQGLSTGPTQKLLATGGSVSASFGVRRAVLATDQRANVVLQNELSTVLSAIHIDEDINDDGWINGLELTGPIDVSFILPASAVSGESLRLTDGRNERVIDVDAEALITGRLVSTFPVSSDNETIEVDATYMDSAGNALFVSRDRAVLDVLANDPPEVSIVSDHDNNGFLSLQEYVSQTVVDIYLPATAAVNDSLDIRVGTRISTVLLSPLDLAEGKISVNADIPAEGSTLSVLAKIFDEAGNVSSVASDSTVIDTEAPLPPSVKPLSTSSSTPVIAGAASNTGDYILSVSVNNITYASGDGNLFDAASGDWILSIPTRNALPDGVYDVSATVIDMAGNRSVDITSNELEVDLVAPLLSVTSSRLVTDPAPLFRGNTDQQGQTIVKVGTIDNEYVCNAVVANEQWSCRSRIVLPVGDSLLTASIYDPAGNSAVEEFSISVIASNDQDGDGIPDEIETNSDADGDGIANDLDLDSDNDTIPDQLEAAIDSDGDQVRDFLDIDSDNDSLSDLYESGLSRLVDSSGSGTIDGWIIVGDNGLADVIEIGKDSGNTLPLLDSDNDGVPDYKDRDSDNDGIEDFDEQAAGPTLAGDNAPLVFNDQSVTPLLVAVDTDRDGVADYLDLDSDQDGLSDVFETLGKHTIAQGRLDSPVDLDKDGLLDDPLSKANFDIDYDGVPNYKDLDSDGDGLSDLVESGGYDNNLDGVHDAWLDQNLNGISDTIDQAYTNGADADSDSIDDLYDIDFVNGRDADNDGVVDRFDVDSNGDGRLDMLTDNELSSHDMAGDRLPAMFESNKPPSLNTGTGPFGCALNSTPRTLAIDPTLVLVLLFSMAGTLRRWTV